MGYKWVLLAYKWLSGGSWLPHISAIFFVFSPGMGLFGAGKFLGPEGAGMAAGRKLRGVSEAMHEPAALPG